MIESLALDALLLLVIIALVPIGMYRGGLREICSAAGLLLGVLIAQAWSDRWGGWIENTTSIDGGVSRFITAVATIVLIGLLIGYGAGASFAYHPGPAGRLYGGVLSLLTSLVVLGALIQFVSLYLYDDVYPRVITRSYLARALSQGFDWVLLTVAFLSVLVTVFGMIVRERDLDGIESAADSTTFSIRRPAKMPTAAAEPIKIEPEPRSADRGEVAPETTPLRIHEVRHWEEPTPPTSEDIRQGWSRTWPSDVARSPESENTRRRPTTGPRTRSDSSRNERVIRDWLADTPEDRRANHPMQRPPRDE